MRFDGVLFFPVTPFDDDGRLDDDALGRHVDAQVAHGPGGVFAACGTGEFHALGLEEYAVVVRTAVQATAGRVPVVAGTGGPLPHAIACATAAAAAGADGLLVFPPYLVNAPEAGLVRYVRAIAAATDLPVIVYQRNNAVFTVAGARELSRDLNVVGFKDGVGDLAAIGRIVEAIGDRFLYFNGLPTAEVSVPAYREVGVRLYSSAAFCFVPEVSLAFYRAVEAGENARIDRLLTDFFRPLAALRDEVPGYAVALVKAGVRLRGLDAGGVRPPLVDPSPDHLKTLESLISKGLEVVSS